MEDPIVQLENGLARGVIKKHEDGFNYYAFRGIPYAEPPIGELRFEEPVPKSDWSGVIDCSNYAGKCLQYDYFTKIPCTNEDCLYLNIFSHSINDENLNKAVIVVVHGGSFLFCSGDDFYYGPEHLIRKDIVLVTFNYRLGVLGFLNLEDEVAPGNQGLKDQLLVLRWVQKNARVFGGDPDNVTLLGISAGAICANYLALSPMSKGLFHKVIFQGAVMHVCWALSYSPKVTAMKLCFVLGKELVDPKEILQFLKSIDAKTLQKAQERLRTMMLTTPFPPGVDCYSPNPIVPVRREILMQQSINMPCIVGCNCQESSIFLHDDILYTEMSMTEFLEMCDKDISLMLQYNSDHCLFRYNVTKHELKQFYFKGEKLSEKNVEKSLELMNDLYFVEAIHRFVTKQVECSSAETYVYSFVYDPPDSLSNKLTQGKPRGAGHFDEIAYMFKSRLFEHFGIGHFENGMKSYKMMELMTEMWTNFAKFGKPTLGTSDLITVDWKPVTDSKMISYLDIDEQITMKSTLNFNEKLPRANN